LGFFLCIKVKIYVAAVEALRKKERQDETQFTTKVDGFLSFIPRFWEVGNDGYIGTYLLIYLPTCWALAMARISSNSAKNCCYYKFEFKRITTQAIMVQCQGL
jgi:hypothetical protein